MNFSDFYTVADHFSIKPAVMMVLFGCAILLFDVIRALGFSDPRQRKGLVIFVIMAECFTAYALIQQQSSINAQDVISGFHGSVIVDGFGIFRHWAFGGAQTDAP